MALVVILGLLGPNTLRPGPGAVPSTGELAPASPALGSSAPVVGASLNNTTNQIDTAVASFVTWFAEGLGFVIVFVFATLLVGGILNYLLVGRRRGTWTPAAVEGIPARSGPPPPPTTDSPPSEPGAP